MIQQVNLYKVEFRPRKLLFSFNQILAVWGVTILGCFFFSWYLEFSLKEQKVSLIKAEQAELKMNQQVKSLEQRLSERTRDQSLQEDNDRLKDTLERGARLIVAVNGGQGDWSRSASMADIFEGLSHQTLTGIALDEIHISEGPELTIAGKTSEPAHVPTYLRNLGNEEVFSGMHFEELKLQTLDDSQLMAFRFSSTKNGDGRTLSGEAE